MVFSLKTHKFLYHETHGGIMRRNVHKIIISILSSVKCYHNICRNSKDLTNTMIALVCALYIFVHLTHGEGCR